jgi:hypothetical protein
MPTRPAVIGKAKGPPERIRHLVADLGPGAHLRPGQLLGPEAHEPLHVVDVKGAIAHQALGNGPPYESGRPTVALATVRSPSSQAHDSSSQEADASSQRPFRTLPLG